MRSVYIACGAAHRHKVGVSSNPRRRLQSLSGAAGYSVALADAREVEDAGAVERMAHWLLRAAHIRGEWFDVDLNTAMTAVSEAIERVSRGERAGSAPGGPGRPKINDEQTPARFPAGTLARIDAVLTDGESRADFIRATIEREVARREREARKRA